MSYSINVNIVNGEAKVTGQSGTLPDEAAIIVNGHEDTASLSFGASLTDATGQRASVSSWQRK